MQPPMDSDARRLDGITERIIGCAFTVANELGSGFLEKVHENALAHELRAQGLFVEQQKLIQVKYRDVVVGDYCADLLVERCVVVELKTVRTFDEAHMAQCLNYLKATGFQVSLLINLGSKRIQVKRIVNNF